MKLYLITNTKDDCWVLDICSDESVARQLAESYIKNFKENCDKDASDFINVVAIDTDNEYHGVIWSYDEDKEYIE